MTHRSQHKSDSDFPFCKFDGSPCDPNFVRDSVLYPAMDRAEIERGPRTHGFHIFRHSPGSIIHRKTGSMKLAQIQLGHADMGTTANIYVHTDDEQLRFAAEVLAEAISPSFLPTRLPTKRWWAVHQGSGGVMSSSNAMKKGRCKRPQLRGKDLNLRPWGYET